jgi:hypothetical protein
MHAMIRLRYVLAILVAMSLYALPFLDYLLPSAMANWLLLIFACWTPLLFFSLGALFRRNRKAIAIYSVAWVLAALPLFKFEPVNQLRHWFWVQGLRIHIAPVERYLCSCELVPFEEDGVTHQFGECESTMLSSDAWESVYDTTGQFALENPGMEGRHV